MNTLDWYNKLARYCEDTPALGSIQYKQIELLAEYIAKIEATKQPACTCGKQGVKVICGVCGGELSSQ